MRLFARFAKGQLKLNRVEAFSDGVFAIVVTLLVLDLHVPDLRHAGSVLELAHGLIDLLPKFLSWAISFIIVCKFWLNHHFLLGQARYADYAVIWLNSLFLMFQSLIPFPTALMGEYPKNSLAVSLFGVVMAVNTLLFMLLQSYITRKLIKPEFVRSVDPHIMKKSLIGPISYLLGTAAAWICIPAAFVVYMITPLFFITPVSREADA